MPALKEMQYINRLEAEAKRYIQVVQVSFHTEEQLYQIRGVAKGLEGELDPTDQLLSVNTVKTLDAPAGTFSISLAGDRWFKRDGKRVLRANDLAIIYMGYKAEREVVQWVDGTKHTSSEDLDTVMIGLIDNVNLARNGGGSGLEPQVYTSVTGRDFGKLIIEAMIKFYPELSIDNEEDKKFLLTEEGWLTIQKVFSNENAMKGDAPVILDTIMRFILKPLKNKGLKY
jgi:hypothetical protein